MKAVNPSPRRTTLGTLLHTLEETADAPLSNQGMGRALCLALEGLYR